MGRTCSCCGNDGRCICVSDVANVESSTLSEIGPNINSQFNELMVAEKNSVISLKSVYGISELRDVTYGTVENNSVEYVISTSDTGSDISYLQSAERGRYEAGYAAEAGIGIRTASTPIGNQVLRWGLFDDQNGLYFGLNSSGIFVAVRRQDTSAVLGYEEIIIPQQDWNIDPLDGTGPSGSTLNLSEGNIFRIVFTWYGYGVIEFQVVTQDPENLSQKVVTVNRYKPIMETSLTDPNLPLRAEADNGGTPDNPLTLYTSGRQYSILGNFTPVFRITAATRSTTPSTPSTLAFISFRRKAIFPVGSARSNSISVKLESLELAPASPVIYQVILGGSVSGTYGDVPGIPPSETGLEVNLDPGMPVGGIAVFKGVAAGGGGNRVLATAELLDLEVVETLPITLVVETLSGGNQILGTLSLREEW
jgi:hypothetical protein